jgi:ribosomal protein L17
MKITREMLRKQRCYNGGIGMKLRISNIDEEELIIKSFIHTNNPHAREMARKYEKMIVLAKVDFEKYLKNRDAMHMELVNYIHSNKLYKEWVDLIYVTLYQMERHELIDALGSELMETWAYLTWDYEKDHYVYGLTTGNELLVVPAYYGDWDVELHRKRAAYEKTKDESILLDVILNDELYTIERNEQIYTNILFGMIPFINERTKNIMPKDWFPHAEADHLRDLPRIWKPTDFYKEQLRRRKYLIDKKGVRVLLKNAGVFREVVLMEDMTKDNKVVMLYRLTTDKGSTVGFYHLADEIFFSGYKYSDGRHFHDHIENFVLELYTEIVCGLEKDKKRLYAIKEVEDIEYIENEKDTHVYVQYVTYDHESDGTKRMRRGGTKQRPHERRFALRKLPDNMTASEEAKQRALELGIELQDGYTFVRAYKVGGVKEIRKEIK